jgi:hypothetical protein
MKALSVKLVSLETDIRDLWREFESLKPMKRFLAAKRKSSSVPSSSTALREQSATCLMAAIQATATEGK